MNTFDEMDVNRIQTEAIRDHLERQNKELIKTLHDAKALLVFWIERNGYPAKAFDDTLTMKNINKLLASGDEETQNK